MKIKNIIIFFLKNIIIFLKFKNPNRIGVGGGGIGWGHAAAYIKRRKTAVVISWVIDTWYQLSILYVNYSIYILSVRYISYHSKILTILIYIQSNQQMKIKNANRVAESIAVHAKIL